jgi:translation elongation factor EF-Ts
MINHHVFKVFSNTICLAYIPETVMNCDVDYVSKPEKYKCLGNTIDGSIFNKHNDQEKKDISKKDLFYLHGIYSIQTSLF